MPSLICSLWLHPNVAPLVHGSWDPLGPVGTRVQLGMEADTGGAASSTKGRHPTIEAPTSDAEEDFLRSAKGGLQVCKKRHLFFVNSLISLMSLVHCWHCRFLFSPMIYITECHGHCCFRPSSLYVQVLYKRVCKCVLALMPHEYLEVVWVICAGLTHRGVFAALQRHFAQIDDIWLPEPVILRKSFLDLHISQPFSHRRVDMSFCR